MAEEKPEDKKETPKAEPKKKTRSTKLNVDASDYNSLTPAQVNQLFEEECQMTNQDRIVRETYEKKNEMESYIYELRGKLNEQYSGYV